MFVIVKLNNILLCKYFQPGRVVTLVPTDDPNSRVWGVAYKIRTEDIEQVTNHLDFREKNGYSKQFVTFHPQDGNLEPFTLTLYVATKDNESYAGKFKLLLKNIILMPSNLLFDTQCMKFARKVEKRVCHKDLSVKQKMFNVKKK